MTRPPQRPTATSGPPRAGFTLIELLVVIVVIGMLVALLLPAIQGAVRTAKNAAATTELKQLDQAFAAFKTQYGDYPPSRVLLFENGWFTTSSTTALTTPTGGTDMTVGQLAQRSLQYMRKFFPKTTFSTSSAVWVAADNQWYDFNGDGVLQTTPYVLEGHQAFVFFLGGLPRKTEDGYAMTGFAKNPANPFTPEVAPSGAPNFFSNNRVQPLFQFSADRLQAPDPTIASPLNTSGFPGYLDSLGNTLGSGQINFIAYFSAYGNNRYDPNDVNFLENDDGGTLVLNKYKVGFPISGATGGSNLANSTAPNPYTTTATTAAVVNYVNPQTYQLISSGLDGQYGPGGMYKANASAGALQFDATATTPAADTTLRLRERDNLTNFHGGTLE